MDAMDPPSSSSSSSSSPACMYVCMYVVQAVQVRNEREAARMMRVLGLEERRRAWKRPG